MTHRAYRNISGEDRLYSYRDYDRTPAATDHHGACRTCGRETERLVTVGPPGHPRNGWECKGCGEAALRATYDRAMLKDSRA